MHLFEQPVDQILAEARPEDVREALLEAEAWSDIEAETADFVLSYWVRTTVGDPRRAGDLPPLRRTLAATQLPHNLAALEAAGLPHGDRWRCLLDLVERQIEANSDRDTERERVLDRRHVPELMQLVAEAGGRGFPQKLARERLDVNPANATRLVRLLERVGYLRHERSGRENLLVLTDEGHAAIEQHAAARRRQRTPDGASQRRNVEFMIREA